MHQAFSLKLLAFLSPPILTHSCYIIFELFFVHRWKDLCLDTGLWVKTGHTHPSQTGYILLMWFYCWKLNQSINQSTNQSSQYTCTQLLELSHWVAEWLGSSVGWSMADHLPGHEFEFLPESLPLFPILTFLSQWLWPGLRSDCQVWCMLENDFAPRASYLPHAQIKKQTNKHQKRFTEHH